MYYICMYTQSREECIEMRAKASEMANTPTRIVNGVQVSYHDQVSGIIP